MFLIKNTECIGSLVYSLFSTQVITMLWKKSFYILTLSQSVHYAREIGKQEVICTLINMHCSLWIFGYMAIARDYTTSISVKSMGKAGKCFQTIVSYYYIISHICISDLYN